MYVGCPECLQPAAQVFELEQHYRAPVWDGDFSVIECACCGAQLMVSISTRTLRPSLPEVITDWR